MARPPKAATRHDLDRMIVGNQIFIMGVLADLAYPAARHLNDRAAEIRAWWRSHYNEDVTVMPAPKE